MMKSVHHGGSRKDDVAALRALYDATDGGHWWIRWDLTSDACTWHGIEMDDNGRVVSIKLEDNNLHGKQAVV